MQLSPTSQRPSRPRTSDPRHVDQSATSHRKLHWNLTVIPVRLDQAPGEVYWSNSSSFDASDSTVSMMIERADPLPGRYLVIGASIDGPSPNFATMAIKSQTPMGGQLRIDATTVTEEAEDLLSEHYLAPRIDAKRFKFQYGCREEILLKWESIGVLRKYLVDRILVCPDCGSIPTWRQACPQCGSGRYRRTRLIHHFACAHVDHADSFRSPDGSIRCPKCQSGSLIAGTDYQYVAGPLNCFDCDESGSQPTLFCMCHLCLSRFDPDAARDYELYGYHVDRLDLLGFLAASE